jgi:ATP-binding cassette, subfamily B, bacterial
MKKNESLNIIFKENRSIKRKIMVVSFISLISSLTAIFFAYFSKETIDSALANNMDQFLIYAVILSLLLLLQIFSSILNPFLKTYYTSKFDIELKNKYYDKILRGKILETSKYHTGSLMNYLYSDIRIVSEGIFEVYPRAIFYLSRFLGAFILLFLLDDILALFLFATGVVLVLASRLLSREIKKRHHKLQEEETKVRQMIQESLEHIEVIKSYQKESAIEKDLDHKQQKFFKALIQKTMLSVFAQGGMTLFFAVGYGAAIIFGAIRLSEGIISFGALTAIIQLVSHIQTPFSGLSQIVPKYYSMIASSERLSHFNLLNQESNSASSISDFDELILSDVSFSYQNKPVIKNMSAQIKKGSIVYVKGNSGRGKTTLIKLLLGFFEPSIGEISFRYQDMLYPLNASTRNLFSYVPQSHFILSGTIKDNLSFYQDASMEDIIEKTKIAQIYDDIMKLPNGFDTTLGERGYGLSLGQIQRLAIARSLLRDTPIYLFDEISSALDQNTENEILSNIKKMTDKTIFIISHRNLDPTYYDIEIDIAS